MPESTNSDCSWPAIAERCERPTGKLTTLCTSAWQPHARSIVMRVSVPSASTVGAQSACCTRCPGISSPRARARPSRTWPGWSWKSCSAGAQVCAHDRVAVEQDRHAAGELAVLAEVLDQTEPLGQRLVGVGHEREAQAVVGGEAAVALVVVDADADERDVRGLVVVHGAVELHRLQRAAVGAVRGVEVHDRGPGERVEVEPAAVARNQLADRKLVADLDGLRHERPLFDQTCLGPDPTRGPLNRGLTPIERSLATADRPGTIWGLAPSARSGGRFAGQDLDQARAVDVAAGDDAHDLAAAALAR